MVAGVDAGARYLKVVILDRERVAGTASSVCGIDLEEAARNAFREAFARASIGPDGLTAVIATGNGADSVPGATARVSVTRAMARAAVRLFGEARTVVDVGAEESRAVRCDERGNVVDFALNDKCAAGAGSFIDALARALEVEPRDLGALARQAPNAAAMNAQCVIFAESEVVSMIHRGIPPAMIARSVYDALAGRISSLLSRIGLEPELVALGGVARDAGFIDALERALKRKPAVPPEPEFACAYGAALCGGK